MPSQLPWLKIWPRSKSAVKNSNLEYELWPLPSLSVVTYPYFYWKKWKHYTDAISHWKSCIYTSYIDACTGEVDIEPLVEIMMPYGFHQFMHVNHIPICHSLAINTCKLYSHVIHWQAIHVINFPWHSSPIHAYKQFSLTSITNPCI